MRTLPQNYAKNVEILKENLKRGMSVTTAHNHVKQMEKQLKDANRFTKVEADFIGEMMTVLFTASTGIKVYKGDE